MPYLVNSRELTRSASQWALLSLLGQARCPPEPKAASVDVTRWPSFTVALQEPPDVIQTWQEVGASTVRVHRAALQLLERLYSFRRRAEVLGFLEKYPFLAPLLLEAYDRIRTYFPDSLIFLEVVADPEANGDYQLVASVAVDLDPDEALENLEQFDEDWWLDALDRAQGMLCIDVEFQ